MRLADELFLIGLDDRTGRLRLAPRVHGLGLAGALLGELILEERLTIEGDRLRILSRLPPVDALAGTVLLHVVQETADHPVRTWLAFLARGSTEQVADRLWRAGYVRKQRSGWRRAATYPPTDANVAFGPTARLATKLGRGEPVTWPEAVLCGLVAATGLDGHVLYNADAAARNYLRHVIAHLSPALHALVWHLHAAVGDAVLTGRT